MNPTLRRTFLERACAQLGWRVEEFNRRLIASCGYRPAVLLLLCSVRLDTQGGEVLRTFLSRLAGVTSTEEVSQEFDVYLCNLRFLQPRWVRMLRLRISGTRLSRLSNQLFISIPIADCPGPGTS